MVEALQTYAVTVAAGLTSAAALYTAAKVRAGVNAFLDTIDHNERRSRVNRRLILDHHPEAESLVERYRRRLGRG